jgi:peptidoglycan/xylan/chitin deacetylase (PgdA/CDA1 family)
VIDAIFTEQGGDERELCDRLYVTWDEAREMQSGGVELGGHTVSHAILSKLEPAEAAREIRAGRESMQRALGREVATFAYPWGRRWDFDEAAEAAVTSSGFKSAVTMHAGTNSSATSRTRLHRLAIDQNAKLHLLVAEACGGFDLLRKVGLDLSE